MLSANRDMFLATTPPWARALPPWVGADAAAPAPVHQFTADRAEQDVAYEEGLAIDEANALANQANAEATAMANEANAALQAPVNEEAVRRARLSRFDNGELVYGGRCEHEIAGVSCDCEERRRDDEPPELPAPAAAPIGPVAGAGVSDGVDDANADAVFSTPEGGAQSPLAARIASVEVERDSNIAARNAIRAQLEALGGRPAEHAPPSSTRALRGRPAERVPPNSTRAPSGRPAVRVPVRPARRGPASRTAPSAATLHQQRRGERVLSEAAIASQSRDLDPNPLSGLAPDGNPFRHVRGRPIPRSRAGDEQIELARLSNRTRSSNRRREQQYDQRVEHLESVLGGRLRQSGGVG